MLGAVIVAVCPNPPCKPVQVCVALQLMLKPIPASCSPAVNKTRTHYFRELFNIYIYSIYIYDICIAKVFVSLPRVIFN